MEHSTSSLITRGRSSCYIVYFCTRIGRKSVHTKCRLAAEEDDQTWRWLENGKHKRKVNRTIQEKGRGRGRGGGRGRGERGGRGGGRGGGQGLIQTGGIFSEGLSGGVVGAKSKDREVLPTFTVSKAKQKEAEKEEKKTDETVKACTSFRGYEALWESDEEAEEEELKEILKTGFISDLKRGTQLPLVLPTVDETQFINVMHKSVKEELFSDTEEEKLEKKPDLEKIDKKKKALLEAFQEEEANPTLRYSRQAAAALRKINQEGSQREFMLFQLPSVVGALCRQEAAAAVAEPQPEDSETPMEVDGEQILPPETAATSSSPTKSPNDSILPPGKTIGKLMVTKRGKVLLKIGEHVMDVTKTIPGGQRQAIVMLETTPEVEDKAAQHPFFRASQPAGSNALFELGAVKNHLMASMTWQDLHLRDTQTEYKDVEMKDSDDVKTESFEEELKELEKTQSSWATLANRWADSS
ncbi:unnamed protein product [Caenorhabditis auriculariae]|uniref:Uncharacterized protein n=1 Tax=Caenorhabditis auriculariae TaxID=2777116 RepID=A0A8S1HUN5_9PELO|nr:unnamed protein product [Caenorhabditis auriculariae]